MSRADDLQRVRAALHAVAPLLRRHQAGELVCEWKSPGHPVTVADREADALLRGMLPRGDEAWLSEESPDDKVRLRARRVWVVDPLDGTRAFLARRPEWSTSIALLEDGEPVLGGIVNPMLDVAVYGGEGLGVTCDGVLAPTAGTGALRVLCSRTEWKAGEWQQSHLQALQLQPVSSVAWKLALVAAGAADATWTRRPKSEWDVAAGAALVRAAGGEVWRPDGAPLGWNQDLPLYPCFAACGPGRRPAVTALLGG